MYPEIATNTKTQAKCYLKDQRNTALNTQFRPLFAFLLAAGIAAAPAFGQIAGNTLPTGAVVAAGNVAISQAGAAMRIKQGSAKAIIDWQSFNIGRDASLQFIQPSASSIALNRVGADGGRSIIDGRLTSNGQVWLLNPGGVLFGPTARVDVGGLLASTLKITNDDFLNDNYRFSKDGNGNIVNQGTLTAANGGYIALLTPEVRNKGVIAARLGTVALASGDEMRVDFSGDRLIEIKVDQGAVNGLIENKNLVKAEGGWVLMSAGAANSLSSGAINSSGIVRATSLADHQGLVRLGGQTTTVSGTLDVHSDTASGGRIEVTGKTVQIGEGAHLTTSGKTGGGEVLVGGSWQNTDPRVAQAVNTYVAKTALLEANATDIGNGGTIVAWSDITNPQSATRAYGEFQAKGGVNGGNGGRIETSGHWLKVDGIRTSTSAPKGLSGIWLLDPYEIDIIDICDGNIYPCTVPDDTLANPDYISANSPSYLYASDINIALNNNSLVTIQTGTGNTGSGYIAVHASISKTAGTDSTLTLKAHGDILIDEGVSISSTSGRLNINLLADIDDIDGGAIRLGSYLNTPYSQIHGPTITTNGGNILFSGGSNPLDPISGFAKGAGADTGPEGIILYNSLLSSGSGSITLRGKGTGNGLGDGIVISNGSIIQTTTGAVEIVATSAAAYGGGLSGGYSSPNSVQSLSGGNITLVSDAIDFSYFSYPTPANYNLAPATPYLKFETTGGFLTIRPFTSGKSIGLGNASGDIWLPGGDGTYASSWNGDGYSYDNYNFTDFFPSRYSLVTIGSASTGNIAIDGFVYKYPVTIWAGGANSTISIAGDHVYLGQQPSTDVLTVRASGEILVDGNLTMLGSPAIAGSPPVPAGSPSVLHMIAGSNINSNSSVITAEKLAIEATGDIFLSGANHIIGEIAGITTGTNKSFLLSTANNLNIATVDNVIGISTNFLKFVLYSDAIISQSVTGKVSADQFIATGNGSVILDNPTVGNAIRTVAANLSGTGHLNIFNNNTNLTIDSLLDINGTQVEGVAGGAISLSSQAKDYLNKP